MNLVYPGVTKESRGYNDDSIRYLVDTSDDRLILNERARERQINALTEHTSVANVGGTFRPVSDVVLGTEPTTDLVTETGYRLHAAQTVRLEESHIPPRVSVTFGNNHDLRVNAQGAEEVVPAGEQRVFELDKQEIEIQRRGDTIVETTDPKNPDESMKMRERGQVETEIVVPELRIINNGELDVYQRR